MGGECPSYGVKPLDYCHYSHEATVLPIGPGENNSSQMRGLLHVNLSSLGYNCLRVSPVESDSPCLKFVKQERVQNAKGWVKSFKCQRCEEVEVSIGLILLNWRRRRDNDPPSGIRALLIDY